MKLFKWGDLQMIRFIVQFLTILFIYLLGNILVSWVNIPIPGSIVGMALLFLALLLGGCKLSWVEEVAQLHIKHFTLFFIPFTVGIFHYTGVFRIVGLKFAVTLAISSLVILLVTAYIAEVFDMNSKRRNENGDSNG